MALTVTVPDLWTALQARGPRGGTRDHLQWYPEDLWDAVRAALAGIDLSGIDGSHLDAAFLASLALADGSNLALDEDSLDPDFYGSIAERTGYDIRRFGAVEGTECSQAILDALAAAFADGRGFVILPPGTWLCEQEIVHTFQAVRMVGAGEGVTILKMADGANLAHLVRLGYPTTVTTTANHLGLERMTLDGNKANQASGTSVLFVGNAPEYEVEDVTIQNGYAVGFTEDTESATTGSTRTARGRVSDLMVSGCGQAALDQFAVEIRGAKNSQYRDFNVRNNLCGGVRLQGRAFTGNKELTQCQFTGFHITDNGSDENGIGLVLDNTTRCVIGDGTINFNLGGGIEFRRTLGTAGTDGANFNEYGRIEMRNNGIYANTTFCGIRTKNSGDLSEADIESIEIQAQTGIADQEAIFIEGSSGLRVDHVDVRLAPNRGIHLKNCTRAQLGIVRLNSNGAVAPSALAPHGMWIEGGQVHIEDLWSNNQRTTVADSAYELNITGGALVKLGLVDLDATDNGQEVPASVGSGVYLPTSVRLRGSSTFVPTVASATSITLPPLAPVVRISGTATINNITIEPAGTRRGLIFDSTAALGHAATGSGEIHNRSGALFTAAAEQMAWVVSDGTDWHSDV